MFLRLRCSINCNNDIFFVVPTLNSSDNLSRLIISLKEQTYSNWRVLFIDGGSNKYNLDKLKNFVIIMINSIGKNKLIILMVFMVL